MMPALALLAAAAAAGPGCWPRSCPGQAAKVPLHMLLLQPSLLLGLMRLLRLQLL
jgi:hypothetical protein